MPSCVAAKRITSRQRLRSTFRYGTCSPASCSCSGYSEAAATDTESDSKKGASAPFLFLEHGNALDVRSMREHVHHPGSREPIALRVDQHGAVAREGRRIAGNVDDPAGDGPRERFHELDRALPRRIEQGLVAGGQIRTYACVEEIRFEEAAAVREPVRNRVRPRAGDQPG